MMSCNPSIQLSVGVMKLQVTFACPAFVPVVAVFKNKATRAMWAKKLVQVISYKVKPTHDSEMVLPEAPNSVWRLYSIQNYVGRGVS